MARAQEVLPPSRLKAQRRKVRTLKRILFGVGFVLLVAALVGVAHIRAIRVREVVVTGTQAVPSELIQESILQNLSGNLWFVIPRNNVAVYSAPALEADVRSQFPKLKSVTISLDTFHSLKVEVTERQPTALWCGTVARTQVEEAGECYFLDEHGYAYELAPSFSGVTYVRWFGVLRAPTIPAQYLEEHTFQSLQQLVASLTSADQTPMDVAVDENNDVSMHFLEGFELRFTLAQKPEEVIASLHAAQKSDALIGKKLSDLQYLDLRFGDRLYYKLR